MKQTSFAFTMIMVCAGVLGCTARAPTAVRGIELEDPSQGEGQAEGSSTSSHSGLVASGSEPSAAPSTNESGDFVYSRDPSGHRKQAGLQLPIHINADWWSFRAQHLGVSDEQAQKRDARLSRSRAPADFWDSQTAVEAVSVWTVLCNECHGGRRSLEDALEMPEPAPAWGEGEGLFFGNRRSYAQMFDIVYDGGPPKEGGRAQMPAWRNILSTEMIWSLLYFLEFQSGGIESRFPPSLYPRRPKLPGEP